MTLDAIMPSIFAFTLVAIRCGALFFMVPTLGGNLLPIRVRGAIAAGTALVLTPLVGDVPQSGMLALALAGVGEFVLGMAMGLVIRLVLMIAELAGEVAGMQMGFAFNRVVDPLSGQNLAVTSRIMGVLSLMVFLALDGHHMVIYGLGDSLRRAPVGTVLPRAIYIETLIPLLSLGVATALRIAAPVMVALLLTNVGIGLLARAAPQLNLFIFAFGVTIGLGTLIFTTAMRPSLTMLSREFGRIPLYFSAVLGG